MKMLLPRVSVEPPPKQGCESSSWRMNRNDGTVSVEPPPKQGCESWKNHIRNTAPKSQWNPRRSRGARSRGTDFLNCWFCLSGTPAEAGVRAYCYCNIVTIYTSLSGTPAEAGVRGYDVGKFLINKPSLSGTPAEAGVRGKGLEMKHINCHVSVEPPPKQGCEKTVSV